MIAFHSQGAAFSLERHLTNAIIRCRAYLVGARQRSDKELAAIFDDAYATELLLPVTRVRGDAESLAGGVSKILAGRSEPPEFQAEVSGVFEELVMNTVQHSRGVRENRGRSAAAQRRGASYAMLEYSTDGLQKLFSVGVRDTGVGIRASLRENTRNRVTGRGYDDGEAIKYATESGTTGTQEERGIGLHHVKEIVADYNGCLFIASGRSCIVSSNNHQMSTRIEDIAKDWSHISGTMSFAGLFVPNIG